MVTVSAHSATGMRAIDVITITEIGTIMIEIGVIVTVGIAVSASIVTGIMADGAPVYVSKTKMATFTAGITEDLRNGEGPRWFSPAGLPNSPASLESPSRCPNKPAAGFRCGGWAYRFFPGSHPCGAALVEKPF